MKRFNVYFQLKPEEGGDEDLQIVYATTVPTIFGAFIGDLSAGYPLLNVVCKPLLRFKITEAEEE